MPHPGAALHAPADWVVQSPDAQTGECFRTVKPGGEGRARAQRSGGTPGPRGGTPPEAPLTPCIPPLPPEARRTRPRCSPSGQHSTRRGRWQRVRQPSPSAAARSPASGGRGGEPPPRGFLYGCVRGPLRTCGGFPGVFQPIATMWSRPCRRRPARGAPPARARGGVTRVGDGRSRCREDMAAPTQSRSSTRPPPLLPPGPGRAPPGSRPGPPAAAAAAGPGPAQAPRRGADGGGGRRAHPRHWPKVDRETVVHGVSGMGAGALASMAMAPLDLLKTRLQVQRQEFTRYRGICACRPARPAPPAPGLSRSPG